MELYFILVPIISAVTYPVVVSWTWGLGWLYQLGFVDFAGSCVVHLAGAMSALTIVLLVGPRKGRFEPIVSSKVVSERADTERKIIKDDKNTESDFAKQENGISARSVNGV
jgi:ammonia channel protein AmtB